MRSWRNTLVLIFLVALLFVLIGCSDRKNPTEVVYPKGTVWYASINSDSLANNLMSNPYPRNIFVYLPPGYDDAGTNRYPVLYFLHGFLDTTLGSSGPGLPYPYGLAETADRLIATGQIKPMIIAMANCNSYLGNGTVPAGSFYVNSPSPTNDPIPGNNKSLNGKFESFYVHEFIKYVETTYRVKSGREYHAIAGHSMGGYGAFRIAMDYDSLFGIVGSLSGPLSFGDWDIDILIKHIFAVNGIGPAGFTDSLKLNLWKSSDETTRMFFAMAAAFSPHKTSSHDSTSYFQVTSSGTAYGVDLPFGPDTNIIDSVWNIWVDSNDVKTLYLGNAAKLDSMAVYIDYGDADEFGFNVQSSDFHDALASGPGDRFFEEYGGGGYMSADNSTYLYYRIESLLKFVSKNLPTTGYEGMPLLNSSAFSNGGAIPNLYCYNVSQGEGIPLGAQNKSIPLSWSNAPSGTQSFAISMIDVNGSNWIHWLVLNIPSTTTSLNAGASGSITGATEYTNEFDILGYGGPLPPKADGVHNYVITVYALSASSLSFTDGTGQENLASFNNAISGKILDQAYIVGIYDWE